MLQIAGHSKYENYTMLAGHSKYLVLQVVGQVLVEVGERAGVGRERVVRGAVGIARRLRKRGR